MKRNKGDVVAQRKRRVQRWWDFINPLKSFPCKDCGKTFPPFAMDFDHISNLGKKKRNISLFKNYSIQLAKEELKKCELVCANCHRIRTWGKERGGTRDKH